MTASQLILGLFFITAFTSYVSGSVVTSCDACHKWASCTPILKAGQAASSQHSSNCSCTKGFSGDGMSCYNTTTCSAARASCCPAGYRWSAEQGCVDIDECSAPQSPCVAPLMCANTPGSFTCLLPQVNANPVSNPRLVQFSCGQAVCNLGQDCITVNGVARCADPCQHYTILEDAWRSTDFKTNGTVHCDMGVNWQGWYRMYLDGVSVQMPERCIQPRMCGTDSPLWLKTPHPVNSDGVVQGTVCGSWVEGCCNFEFPIHVKACPGNYYVYKFVKPPLCFLAYAADANTKVCATCREGTSCVSADKITWTCQTQDPVRLSGGSNRCEGRVELYHSGRWGTICDDDWNMNAAAVVCRQLGCGKALAAPVNGRFGPGSGPIWMDNTQCQGTEAYLVQCKHNGFENHNCGHYEDAGVICEEPPTAVVPQLVCNRTMMRIGVPAVHRGPNALNMTSGHLADPTCMAQRLVNGTVWYEVQSRAAVCGNVLKINSTHAVYSNTLFLYPANNSVFSLPTGFPFSCVYPLDSRISMDIAVRPYLSMQEMGLVGVGPGARASMSLYRNANFTAVYPPGPVVLPVGAPLYVGVNVEEVEASRFAVIVDECSITDTPNPDNSERYLLIQNRCPSDPRDVLVIENGVSLQARFTALLFLYEGNYNDMFLHCRLSLCDRTTESCSTKCQTRTSRSISSHRSLTIGPISWTKEGH
ncbi:pancreatic secretory granule membrane major glycoprotein GP2-like [Colossoma macropomum]|uniref:pancreatic secretory granule membrane major glycoprotein GP2-like n=1 Tax=Colossoma macropomum TaxID=42526 RepID=UPI001865481F|nr:pancreatic secretory granule membrane major glycoprotein GP2-like [Colossoma macropomum]XP_036440336.1 pancreatic secretory granule membrane major glycoprotein GP2-like [Colossoma macropomum]